MRFASLIWLVGAMSVLGACAELNTAAGNLADAAARPDVVTGERQLNLVAPAEEHRRGREIEQAILGSDREQGFAVDADEALRNRCLSVMQRIVAVSHRPDIPITLHLIENPAWNASATIGGYVFVNRGLFTSPPAIASDDELAAVLGHEWGHVTAGHISESISRAQVDRRMQSGVYAASFQFARGQEDEADKLGVLYATLAGFDPKAATGIWERMLKLRGPGAPYLMQVHPLDQDRVASTARYGALAAKYSIPGQANPQAAALLKDNEVVPRAQQTEGVVALLDATANYLAAGEAAKAEQRQREAQQVQQQAAALQAAERAIRAAVDDSVALQLRQITHPTGSGARLGAVVVQRERSGLRVVIPFSWSGGFTGRTYTTTVVWHIGPEGHVGSAIRSDTSVIAVSAANVARVDEYLRDTVLPSVVARARKK